MAGNTASSMRFRWQKQCSAALVERVEPGNVTPTVLQKPSAELLALWPRYLVTWDLAKQSLHCPQALFSSPRSRRLVSIHTFEWIHSGTRAPASALEQGGPSSPMTFTWLSWRCSRWLKLFSRHLARQRNLLHAMNAHSACCSSLPDLFSQQSAMRHQKSGKTKQLGRLPFLAAPH